MRPTIALVNPPYYRGPAWGKGGGPPLSLGLGYLAAYLRGHGYTCDIFDLSCMRQADPKEIVENFKLHDYEIVGISVYTQTFPVSRILSYVLKAMNPQISLIFGGPHATAAAGDILRECKEVDFVVRMDGERPLLGIAEQYPDFNKLSHISGLSYRDRQTEKPIHKPLSEQSLDLDNLPFPLRSAKNGGTPTFSYYCEGEQVRKLAIMVVSTRGCPYQCSFCIISSSRCHTYKQRSAKSVLSEVETLMSVYNFNHLWFVDANFLLDSGRALAIARGLREIDKNLTWSCTGRPDNIVQSRSAVVELSKLGLVSVEVGIESGADSVLRRWNKGVTANINAEAISILKECGISIGLDFIMFDHLTTREELEADICFLKKNGLYGYSPPDCLYSEIRLYPGTPIRHRYTAEKEMTWSNNIIPSYKIEDSESRQIYELVSYFEKTFQTLFESAVALTGESLYKVRTSSDYQKQALSQQDLRRLQQLRLWTHVLRWIPYLVFEALVTPGTLTSERDIINYVEDLLAQDICAFLEKVYSEAMYFDRRFANG